MPHVLSATMLTPPIPVSVSGPLCARARGVSIPVAMLKTPRTLKAHAPRPGRLPPLSRRERQRLSRLQSSPTAPHQSHPVAVADKDWPSSGQARYPFIWEHLMADLKP